MYKKIPVIAVIAALALLSTGTLAYAEQPQPKPGAGKPPTLRGDMHASTTWMQGSTTPERHGSTTPMDGMKGRAFPGIVTSVSTNSFMMSGRGMGEHASTTFTVNIASTTKFMHGSTTASLAGITVGTKVEVMGRLATSTKTILAERVVISGEGKDGEHGPKMPPPGKGKGLLEKLKSFFGFHMGGNASTSSTTGGPAAAETAGGGGWLHMFFGWFNK